MDQPDTASARGDGELLAEFALHGRQEAFTTVARRHAAMVLRVCGRRLGNTSDAQDAAQAVFLTLARRAASLTGYVTVAGWLHRVAWYVAARSAKVAAVRRRHELEAARMRSENPTAERPIASELLDDALATLPEKYRLPLILHHLEGQTEDETAALLGLSVSATSSRLSRAREKLRARLSRGGAAVTAGAVAAALAGEAAANSLATPAALLSSIGQIAASCAGASTATAAISASAAALSKGAIHMLFIAKMKLAALVTAAVMLVGGVGVGTYVLAQGGSPPVVATGPAPAAAASGAGTAAPAPAPRPVSLGEALGKTITIRAEVMGLNELCPLIQKVSGLHFSVPPLAQLPRVRLTTGEQTVRAAIEAAAKSAALDLDYLEVDGKPVACFWLRPEASEWELLRKLAVSADESERCTAARWLPLLGTKDALVDALKLLSDRSRRVRIYAAHALITYWGRGFWSWRVTPLRSLAPEGTAKAVAEELGLLAEEHRTSSAGRPRFWFIQLAMTLGDPVALPALEQFASHEAVERDTLSEGSTISQSLQAIAAIGGDEAERYILDLAQKARGNARLTVAQAIGALDTPKARERIIAGLRGNYEGVRAVAFVNIAGRPGTDRSWLVEPLVELLKKGPDYTRPAGRPTPEEIKANQQRQRKAFESNLICALLRTGAPAGLAKAKEYIEKESDATAQADLCWRLWLDAPGAKAEAEWLRPRVEKLVEAREDRARQTAVNLLGFVAPEQSVPLLLKLAQPETDRHLKSSAVRGLAAAGTEPAVKHVLECLTSPDVDLRAAAAQFAGEFGLTKGLPALRELLKDKEPRVRAVAARSLGLLLDADSVEALVAALRQDGERVDPKTGRKLPDGYRSAQAALEQLGVIGGARAAEELVKAAKDGQAPALAALALSRDPDCAQALRKLLASDGPALFRKLAASGQPTPHDMKYWGRVPAARLVVPLFIELLSSPEVSVKRTAAGWLEALYVDPRAVSGLIGLLSNDPDETVREAAIRALHGSWDMMVDPAAAEALVAAHKNRREPPKHAAQQDPLQTLMDMGACGDQQAVEAIREYFRAVPRTAPPEPDDL